MKDGARQRTMNASFKSIAATPSECKPPITTSLAESLSSLTIHSGRGIHKEPRDRNKNMHEEMYAHDGGLACLLSQLRRIDSQIRHNDSLKKVLSDYEDEYKQKAIASDSKANKPDEQSNKLQWVKCYDDEVGAEFFFNQETGEASWVDPDA